MAEEHVGKALMQRYVELMTGADDSIIDEIFPPDFVDHVSGRTGREIWRMVRHWGTESFGDLRVEVHSVMTEGDRVMIWLTTTGKHIGNGFPFLAGKPITGREVSWDGVHFFRVENNQLAEHWAVRNDLSLIRQLEA
ncbi:ester cyclase [Kribbella sp. NPDC006257]|uniref:ester cyclase n=1 Tax=Kribbella sp. NPDC006257 TaxID=3156738 RepID=UPI0033AB8D4C